MGNTLSTATLYLVGIIFDLYILILMLRGILQYLSAPYHNPFCQFLLKMTNPIVKPLQRLIPGYGGVDFAIVALILVFEIIKLYIVVAIRYGLLANIAGILVWSAGGLINQFINVFFYTIIIKVILSWITPSLQNPAIEILYMITEPLLRLGRRILPAISGIDFSPIIVIIVLKLAAILVSTPLIGAGIRLIVS